MPSVGSGLFQGPRPNRPIKSNDINPNQTTANTTRQVTQPCHRHTLLSLPLPPPTPHHAAPLTSRYTSTPLSWHTTINNASINDLWPKVLLVMAWDIPTKNQGAVEWSTRPSDWRKEALEPVMALADASTVIEFPT